MNAPHIQPMTPAACNTQKLRRTPPPYKSNPNQDVLFDGNGHVPFCFATDAAIRDGVTGKVKVAGMRFLLTPAPRDLEKAVLKTISAIRQFHAHRPPSGFSASALNRSIKLTIGDGSACVVTVRKDVESTAIRVDHNSRENELALSLPPPKLWGKAGLGWLGQKKDCCERNRDNPTPWIGRSCGCSDDV